MCGRFTQHYTWAEVHRFLDVFGPPRNLKPRYNIAPSTPIEIVRRTAQGRELAVARWGLVPAWWKKPLKELPASFNARVESVAVKPLFRAAFRDRRCLIPASGFYEWTGGKGARQPHLFTAADGAPLAFAGLWERWRDPRSGEDILSATIIVGDANDWVARFHDRMPVMVAPAQFDSWLDGSLGAEALAAIPAPALRAHLVAMRLNRAGEGDDDPSVITPLSGEGPR